MNKLEIRKARENDVHVVLNCIKGLAEHVGQIDKVTATEDTLKKTIFGNDSFIEVCIAFLNNKPVGFVLFFKTYSTFKAMPGLYIEDLFVFPEYRNRGIGKQLIEYVINFGKANNFNKVEWYVNNNNAKAIDFYIKMKAKRLDYKSIFYVDL